jgi:hypothetical protein
MWDGGGSDGTLYPHQRMGLRMMALAARKYDGLGSFEEEQEAEDAAGSMLAGSATDKAISSSTRGYKLLLKLGWKEGSGLGKGESGRLEPVKVDSAVGMLGLGKAAEYDEVSAQATAQRKRLEAELQACETEDRRQKRELEAKKQHIIQETITNQNRPFFCDLCNKQYKTVTEMSNHLSSYDHHHTKRMMEARISERERARSRGQVVDREKEQAKEYKELQRRANAIATAAAAAAAPVTTSSPPEEEKGTSLIASQGQRSVVKFGFGLNKNKSKSRTSTAFVGKK